MLQKTTGFSHFNQTIGDKDLELPIEPLIPVSKSTIGTATKNANILQELINASQCTNYSKWLRVIWHNQGILTNQLSEHGLQSNNHHNADQKLNPCIEPLGWKIVKRIKTKRNESWAWFIQPIDSNPAAQLVLNLGDEVMP